jgi:hypothetical protein
VGEAKRRNESIEQVIDGLLKENPNAQAAFRAICARGQTERFARDEIGRAFLSCLWEVWYEKVTPTGRFEDVMRLLENGLTTADIFPDGEDEAA